MEIATAYEILSSDELRKAYDDVSRCPHSIACAPRPAPR
jgi:hypothetical protein